ncbi:MAG: hypothetical protein ACRDKG_15010 [Actinomycetota bacterium]
MVETVFLDWALAFGAGLLFGMAGRGESASVGALMRTRAFKWGLAYLHIGVIAISATLYAIEPDWMWMYWVDPRPLPIVAVVLVFLAYEACFFAGFALASEIERQRRNATWILTGIMFAAITLGEVLTYKRLFYFGTIDDHQAGTLTPGISFDPFHLEPAMVIVLGPGLLATVAVVVIAVRLWRDDVAKFGRPPGGSRRREAERVA